MIKFLIHRPIAVIMSFIAFLLMGWVAAGLLPISLMPDINIPEITVYIERPNASARELENSIVKPMRQRLMQVAHLEDIKSETKEGSAQISLQFKYAYDINYAFIDVNEKVDEAMRILPKDVNRPAVIKASATDLPVFYLNISSNSDFDNISRFIKLSEFTEAVVCKRLEQQSEIAMVDITGQILPELLILPKEEKMNSLGLKESIIHQVLNENNINHGSIKIIDGLYQYNIRLSNSLLNIEDVRNIYLNVNGRILQLKDIADINIRAQQHKGFFLQEKQKALSLAIFKHSDARMEELKEKVSFLIENFRTDFPELDFSLVRDQTGILVFAINNLKQSLVIGALLAFFIMFLFLKDYRSPLLIGISIPVSLIISLLFFYLLGLSLNIISLSGLILGVGMMIDNSIIVIDNITQHLQRGNSLVHSCIKGTKEVMRPLISSVLTTCAVFLPLIFISGISGALFYDQAIAITIGLSVSLIVSVILLPTLYRLFWLKDGKRRHVINHSTKPKLILLNYEKIYELVWNWVFQYRKLMMSVFLILIFIGAMLAWQMKKERFPAFEQDELFMHIDWNECIHVNENKKRVLKLFEYIEQHCKTSNAYVGRQQYMNHKDLKLTNNESEMYIQLEKSKDIKIVKKMLKKCIRYYYPKASFDFSFPESIFERLFANKNASFITHISVPKSKKMPNVIESNRLIKHLQKKIEKVDIEAINSDEQLEVRIRPEMMALYDVQQSKLYTKLKAAINANQIGVLRSNTFYMPIVISGEAKDINKILAELKINNKNNKEIPLNQLVDIKYKLSHKTLYGGKEGEYLPVRFILTKDQDAADLVNKVHDALQDKFDVNLSFSGELFTSKQLLSELLIVMFIALSLLYFILAAQFESFMQPLIVLIEIPIDIAGAFGMLWLFDGSINLMSMIGIIVMSGIIINDSILKIDTINQLRCQGNGLIKAIKIGGQRRLKPILMTSLTTILALLPFLFQSDMGSRLQQPLALTVIGGMILGTFVSLYFIPLSYYYLYRKS